MNNAMPIDFHSHILPHMDDGSKSPEMTRAMLDEMASQGVRRVIATPHFYSMKENLSGFFERRDRALEGLRSVFDPSRHPKIGLGAEVAYFHGMYHSDALEKLCIVGTRYLLLEMPFCRWDRGVVEEVLGIERESGIRPILAHVERYLSFERRSTFDLLHQNDIMFQSNASFFINRRTQRRALRMLGAGMINFLGSDCHNMGERKPDLGGAVKIITEHGVRLDVIRESEAKVFSRLY